MITDSTIEQIAKALESLPIESRDRIDVSTQLDFMEWCDYQDLKSTLQASGRISFELATWFYQILGSGPDSFNSQSLATRIVFHQAIKIAIS